MKHRVCTICIEVENRVIEMYGHNLIHHDAKAPTCTQKGWEAYDTCSRGDYTTYVEIEATGHTESDWIIDEEVTCTKDGSKHKECTVCHEKLETATIDMLGHDLKHHDAKAPTCIDLGWEEYYTCSRCDYTTYVEIPAKGHTYGDWIIDKEATCTEDGSKHKECTVCHEKLETEEILPLGHSFTNYVSNNDATTTEDGTKTAICDRYGCNEKSTITDKGSMKGHEYSTPVWNWNGYESATASFKCQTCEEEKKHIEDVKATITSEITTPVTCTSDGVRTYIAKVTFGGIDYSDSKDETLTMLGHDYVAKWNWISYESVEVTFTCSHDNTHSGSATITGDGITYEITIPATCESDGVKTYTATANFEGKDYIDQKTETIKATGHGNWNDNVCGNCGYDAGGSKGLNMAWNAESETFSVNGIGNCTANDIEIPATYNGYPVTEIGSSAFKNCGLSSINLSDSLISIGGSAFEGCNQLIDVKIPDNVTSYGNSLFKNCTKLESVIIGKSITVINRETFYQCVALTSITIPEGLTVISDYAFYDCDNLSNVTLPSSLKSIGNYAFSSCGMLKGITIPEGITTVGNQAFSDSALREITLPNSITELGSYVFRACFSLTKANVPSKLDLIPTGLFTYCSKLEQVDISEGIKKISNEAFYGCYSLQSLTVPEGVTEIGVHTFYNCKALKALSLPDSLTKIETEAFVKCKSLESLTLSNITDMGENAFQNCTGLKTLIIKGGIIGSYAFNCCVSLETVTLEEGVISS